MDKGRNFKTFGISISLLVIMIIFTQASSAAIIGYHALCSSDQDCWENVPPNFEESLFPFCTDKPSSSERWCVAFRALGDTCNEPGETNFRDPDGDGSECSTTGVPGPSEPQRGCIDHVCQECEPVALGCVNTNECPAPNILEQRPECGTECVDREADVNQEACECGGWTWREHIGDSYWADITHGIDRSVYNLNYAKCCGDDGLEDDWIAPGYMEHIWSEWNGVSWITLIENNDGYCLDGNWHVVGNGGHFTGNDGGTCEQYSAEGNCAKLVGDAHSGTCEFEYLSGETLACHDYIGCEGDSCACVPAEGQILPEPGLGIPIKASCQQVESLCIDHAYECVASEPGTIGFCCDTYGNAANPEWCCSPPGGETCVAGECVELPDEGECYQNYCVFLNTYSNPPYKDLGTDAYTLGCCNLPGEECVNGACKSCIDEVGEGNCKPYGVECCGSDGFYTTNIQACRDATGIIGDNEICLDGEIITVEEGHCYDDMCVEGGELTSGYNTHCCPTGHCLNGDCDICTPEGGSEGETGCKDDLLCDGETGLLTDDDSTYCDLGTCVGSQDSECLVCQPLGECVDDWCCNPETGLLTTDYSKCDLDPDQMCHDGTVIGSVYSNPHYIFYDERGRYIQSQVEDSDGSGVITSHVDYDEMDRQTRISKAYENFDITAGTLYTGSWGDNINGPDYFSEFLEYDGLGRLIRSQTPLGNGEYAEVNNEYGSDFQEVTDPEGHTTRQEFDAWGMMTKLIDAKGQTWHYEYDFMGNLKKIINPKNQEINNSYDKHNRLIRTEHPDTGVTEFDYDQNGNLIEIDHNGRVITFSYNFMNQNTLITYPDGSTVTTTYDDCENGIGKICRIDDASGSTVYSYDERGRVILQVTTVDDSEYTIGYTYNEADNIKTETLPNSIVIEYDYNSLGQLEKIKHENQIIADFDYNPTGNIRRITYDNNVQTEYEYYPTDIIRSVLTDSMTETIFQRYFVYDKVGNLKEMKDGITASSPVLAEFGYDELYRLTTVQDNSYYGGDISYTYDAIGNRETKAADGSSYTYIYQPGTNRLDSIIMGSNTVNLEYDNFGNLEFKSGNGITQGYSYNLNNMMTSVDTDGDSIPDIEYTYNYANQRVKEVSGGKTTVYVYDIFGNMVYEEDKEGPPVCDSGDFDFEGNKFIIWDSNSLPVAMIDENGMMLIKGSVMSFEAPDGNDFLLQDNNGETKMWIDDLTGNLYLSGSIAEETAPLENPDNDELIIMSEAGENIAIFDGTTGSLTLNRCIVENYAFE